MICAANAGVASCNYNPVVEAIDSLQDELFQGDFDGTCLSGPDPAYDVECIQVLTLVIDAGKSCPFHILSYHLEVSSCHLGQMEGPGNSRFDFHNKLPSDMFC